MRFFCAKENVITGIVVVAFLAPWLTMSIWVPAVKNCLDDAGWIPHSIDTPTWMGGDWLTGEYRSCDMPGGLWGRLPTNAHLLCSSDGRAREGLFPAQFHDSISPEEENSLEGGSWHGLGGHFHVLPVKYWGRIDRKDKLIFIWRCQRQASGLECGAIN
jgi:hypothetical protein